MVTEDLCINLRIVSMNFKFSILNFSSICSKELFEQIVFSDDFSDFAEDWDDPPNWIS